VTTTTNAACIPLGQNEHLQIQARAEGEGTRPEPLPSAREVQRPPTWVDDLSIALRRLSLHLQIASDYDPAAADHGRSSVIVALIGVIEFLSVLCWNAPAVPAPLQDLLQALVDLDRGTSNPLFTRAKSNSAGRPPSSLAEELFRAMVAAAMTKRVDDPQMSLELAARDIARRAIALGYPEAKISHGQIAKWREKMMEGDFESRAVQRYRLALELVKDRGPVDGAEYLLSHLPALYPIGFAEKRTS
jgi:hypothetical protein